MPTEEQIKAGLKKLQDPETIAKAFDAAKDAVTDIIVAGEPGSEENVLILIKCSDAVTPEGIKGLVQLAANFRKSRSSRTRRMTRRFMKSRSPTSPNRCSSPSRKRA